MDAFSWWLVAVMAVFVVLYIAAVVWCERWDRRHGVRGLPSPSPAPASAPVVSVVSADVDGVIVNMEAAAQASNAAAVAAAAPPLLPVPAPAPVRRERLGVVQTDGERMPLYTSDTYARGCRMVGLAMVGGRMSDLEQLRETWVILPKHWMN